MDIHKNARLTELPSAHPESTMRTVQPDQVSMPSRSTPGLDCRSAGPRPLLGKAPRKQP